MITPDRIWGVLIALFCGAFIGLEREMEKAHTHPGELDEHGKPVPPYPAGLRTHMILALLGSILLVLDEEAGSSHAFSLAGLFSTAVLAGVIYGIRAVHTLHYGATTVFTLLSTYGLGALAMAGQHVLAAGLAVAITALLTVKVPLRRFVAALTRAEIAAAVKFGLVAVVILPMVPDRAFGPGDWPWLARRLTDLGVAEEALDTFAVVNPFRVWLLVVLIAGIGMAGYVLVRSMGPEKGLTVTGFVGGMVSSTAVTLSMAQRARESPQAADPIASAVLAACSVMAARVVVVALAFEPRLVPSILLPMAAMGLSSAAIAGLLARRPRRGEGGSAESMRIQTPFALGPALRFALLFLLIRLVGTAMTAWLGGRGLVVTAAFSGLVDVDAITATVCQEMGREEAGVTVGLATAAIFTAVAVNTVVKGSIMLFGGSREVGRTTMAWLLVTLAVGALGLVASGRLFRA